jgi:predicted DNA-binding transcriptional regulator AlpA
MTTIFDNAQSSEMLYASRLRSSERESYDGLVGAAEIAQLFKVPISWVYERTRRRGIDRMPHFKLGKYLRFSIEEVLEWLHKLRRN